MSPSTSAQSTTLPKHRLLLGLEILATGCSLLPFAILLTQWSLLPDQVPLHFDLHGEPDSWGSKSSLIIIPLIGLFNFALMTGLAYAPGSLQYMNLPKGTNRNDPRTLKLVRELLAWVKLGAALLLTMVAHSQVNVALKITQKLNLQVTVGLTVFLAALPLIYLFKFKKLRY